MFVFFSSSSVSLVHFRSICAISHHDVALSLISPYERIMLSFARISCIFSIPHSLKYSSSFIWIYVLMKSFDLFSCVCVSVCLHLCSCCLFVGLLSLSIDAFFFILLISFIEIHYWIHCFSILKWNQDARFVAVVVVVVVLFFFSLLARQFVIPL